MNSKIYNLIPDLALFSSVGFAILLHNALPVTQVIPKPINSIGLIISFVGFLLAIYTLSILKSKNTSTNAAEYPSKFITNGVFSISRNPFYLFCAITLTGVCIFLGSVTSFIAPLIYFLIINFVVIPVEEKSLIKVFGDQYKQYRDRVRRWI